MFSLDSIYSHFSSMWDFALCSCVLGVLFMGPLSPGHSSFL
jgi:hypothetical protein